MEKFKAKDRTVEAEHIPAPWTLSPQELERVGITQIHPHRWMIETSRGPRLVSGDIWLVKGEGGKTVVMYDREFSKYYEPAEGTC